MARVETLFVSKAPVSLLPGFFLFSQNNSGGTFDIDDKVAPTVIIEANSAAAANDYAEGIGIYFNGCDAGTDCSCCGDRWYKQYGDEPEYKTLEEVEAEWSNPVKRYEGNFPWTHNRSQWCKIGEPYVHIYTLDGRKITFTKDE